MKKCLKTLLSVTALNLMVVSVSLPTYAAEGWKQNQTGWWYEYNDNSYPADSWLKVNEEWYYFDATGYMKTGWIQENNNWYYLSDDGSMLTGWLEYKNQWYFLQENGAMATSTTIDGYRVNADGIWITSISGGSTGKGGSGSGGSGSGSNNSGNGNSGSGSNSGSDLGSNSNNDNNSNVDTDNSNENEAGNNNDFDNNNNGDDNSNNDGDDNNNNGSDDNNNDGSDNTNNGDDNDNNDGSDNNNNGDDNDNNDGSDNTNNGDDNDNNNGSDNNNNGDDNDNNDNRNDQDFEIITNSNMVWHEIDRLTESYYHAFYDEIDTMLGEVNEIRADAGAAPLLLDKELSKAAMARSIHMISYGYFSHDYEGVDQSQYVAQRYQIPVNGENIAWIQGRNATPEQFVENWKNSSGHYRNMISTSYTEIGMGFVPNDANGVYAVQLFTR